MERSQAACLLRGTAFAVRDCQKMPDRDRFRRSGRARGAGARAGRGRGGTLAEGIVSVKMGVAASSSISWHDVRDMSPPELADLVRYHR